MPEETPLANQEKPKEGKITPNERETVALAKQDIEYKSKDAGNIIGEFINKKTGKTVARLNDETHSIDYIIKDDGSVLIDIWDKSKEGKIASPPRLIVRDGRISAANGIDGMGPGTRYAIIGKYKD